MAGKGFTVKKDWDNPVEHPMPAEARVPAEMRIGQVLVSPATVLAPMAGVTDTVFRRFIRHGSLFSAESETRQSGNPTHVSEARPGAPLSLVIEAEKAQHGGPDSSEIEAEMTNQQS